VNSRRWIAVFAAIAFVQLASSHSPLAAPKADVWTPERVRTFVLKVEREMDKLAAALSEWRYPGLNGPSGGIPESWTKKVATPRIRAYLEGEAVACYAFTYLGGEGPLYKPFNRSKVTIIEQTADRVVANVTEIYVEEYFDGEAKCCLGDDHQVPFTKAEIAAVKNSSRYTITRGKDGVWRISDRKPSFPWVCKDSPDETPPGLT
jgi:hypothetical protein